MVALNESISASGPRRPSRCYRVTASYPQGGNGVAAGTVQYTYYDSQWQAIETRTNGTAASNVTSQTVWSAAYINAPILQDTYNAGVIQPNSRLYFTQDANWDTTAVVGYNATTGTWQVVQRYVYSPYGTITILNADWSATPTGTAPIVNNLYQGMTLDPVTGLYYERARWYSPSLGTWISQDPLSYINGANTYQFVMSNPVGGVDPSGRVTGKDVLTWMTATYHEVPGGGEWVDAAGIISRTLRPWIYKTAQNRAIHDMDRCPAKGTKDDPYYHGLMNMAQGQPLTTTEHDALQRRLNTAYPFWDVFWMHVFDLF